MDSVFLDLNNNMQILDGLIHYNGTLLDLSDSSDCMKASSRKVAGIGKAVGHVHGP